MLGTVLIILLVLLLIGALPQLGFHQYGYQPMGVVGIVIIILVVLLLAGRL